MCSSAFQCLDIYGNFLLLGSQIRFSLALIYHDAHGLQWHLQYRISEYLTEHYRAGIYAEVRPCLCDISCSAWLFHLAIPVCFGAGGSGVSSILKLLLVRPSIYAKCKSFTLRCFGINGSNQWKRRTGKERLGGMNGLVTSLGYNPQIFRAPSLDYFVWCYLIFSLNFL